MQFSYFFFLAISLLFFQTKMYQFTSSELTEILIWMWHFLACNIPKFGVICGGSCLEYQDNFLLTFSFFFFPHSYFNFSIYQDKTRTTKLACSIKWNIQLEHEVKLFLLLHSQPSTIEERSLQETSNVYFTFLHFITIYKSFPHFV